MDSNRDEYLSFRGKTEGIGIEDGRLRMEERGLRIEERLSIFHWSFVICHFSLLVGTTLKCRATSDQNRQMKF